MDSSATSAVENGKFDSIDTENGKFDLSVIGLISTLISTDSQRERERERERERKKSLVHKCFGLSVFCGRDFERILKREKKNPYRHVTVVAAA
jgi:hypothetical protein